MQFGFKIAIGAADGLIHVVTPYRQHFSRPCDPRRPSEYVRLGRGEMVLDRSGRLRWCS